MHYLAIFIGHTSGAVVAVLSVFIGGWRLRLGFMPACFLGTLRGRSGFTSGLPEKWEWAGRRPCVSSLFFGDVCADGGFEDGSAVGKSNRD